MIHLMAKEASKFYCIMWGISAFLFFVITVDLFHHAIELIDKYKILEGYSWPFFFPAMNIVHKAAIIIYGFFIFILIVADNLKK